MSATSLDLSARTELAWVAELVRPIREAAAGARLFVVGAMARELVLVHGYNLHPGRATRDLDFAVRVADWAEYERIRASLIADGGFAAIADIPHGLQSPGAMMVDLLPFGAVESPQRTIAWPPEGDPVMTMLGFAEVADTAITVTLPGGVHIDVAGPADQALLKLVAWSDRHSTRRGSDAYDLATLLRNYLDAGNERRLYDEATDLLDDPDFDRDVAGAVLLGRDIAARLGQDATAVIRSILAPEIDPDGPLRLAGDLDRDPEAALRLLQALARGLNMAPGPAA